MSDTLQTMRRIAVTGATGFVGVHLVRALLGQGYLVRALVRSVKKLPKDIVTNTNFEFTLGSLEEVPSAFCNDINCVIHLAGIVKAQRKSDFFEANEVGAGHVAALAEKAGVAHFILLSSLTAREPQLSHYAASKAAGEAAVRAAFKGPLTVLRAPAVFGPGDWASKPLFDLMEAGFLPVPAKRWKEAKIAMIYVNDLVVEIVRSLDGRYAGEIMEPCTDGGVSWEGLTQLASVAMKRNVKPIPLPRGVLLPYAALTSASSRLFGKGHMTLGKLREFSHVDWTSAHRVDNPTPMCEAMAATVAAYRNES